MNDKLNQCCKRLQQELKAAETCLEQTGSHLAVATETGGDALEARLKSALAKCDEKREHATQAGQRVKQFIAEAKQNAVARFEDWKTDREIAKIEKDADRKEQQAVDAIVVAAFALLEAEVALVDALRARKFAIEVAG